MEDLQIRSERMGGAPLLGLDGRLDVDTAPRLRKVLLGHLKDGVEALVLDLSELRFMDTGGLATLIEFQQRMGEHNGRLVLFGLSDRVADAVEMARAGDLFTVVEAEEEARELVE